VRITISRRIFGTLGLVTLLAGGIAIYLAIVLAGLKADVADIEQGAADSVRAERLLGRLHAVVGQQQAVLAAAGGRSVAVLTTALGNQLTVIERDLDSFEASRSSGASDAKQRQQAAIAEIVARTRSFVSERRDLIVQLEKSPEATRQRLMMDATFRQAQTDLIEAYRTLSGDLQTQLSTAADGLRQTSVWMTAALAAATLVWFAFLFAVALPFIHNSIVRPLRRIGIYMTELAEGRTDMEIRPSRRGDEVGDMWRALIGLKATVHRNQMMLAELRHRDDLEVTLQRDAAIKQEAESFSQRVSETTVRLSSLVSEISGRGQRMSEAAIAAADSGHVMLQITSQTVADVESISVATEQLSGSTREIADQTQQSTIAVRETANRANQTSESLKALTEAAERVGSVIKFIETVAAQTNLLALNATIEAARAGESGRGFAVVAQEVKSLAGKTATATSEIGSQIRAMQSATTTCVTAVEAILSRIAEIEAVSAAVSAAIEEQSSASEDVAQNVRSAADGTRTIANAARTAAETTAISSENAEAVTSIATQLADEAEAIRQQIEQFTALLAA
jgi:methyl-accepting chemotaxis protein